MGKSSYLKKYGSLMKVIWFLCHAIHFVSKSPQISEYGVCRCILRNLVGYKEYCLIESVDLRAHQNVRSVELFPVNWMYIECIIFVILQTLISSTLQSRSIPCYGKCSKHKKTELWVFTLLMQPSCIVLWTKNAICNVWNNKIYNKMCRNVPFFYFKFTSTLL